MMVAMVVGEEDAQPFFIVGSGEAFSIPEVISGEPFDRPLDFGGNSAVRHSWRHDVVSRVKEVSWGVELSELVDAACHLRKNECHYIAMTLLIDWAFMMRPMGYKASASPSGGRYCSTFDGSHVAPSRRVKCLCNLGGVDPRGLPMWAAL